MNRLIIMLLSIIFLLVISCTNKKTEVVIDCSSVSVDLSNIKDPDFKQIFSSIDIIPLETNDSLLIGKLWGIKKALLVPDRFYVIIDNNYIIYLFDSNGKFISNSSKCIGKGPKEYFILQDVAYNHSNNTFGILDPMGNILVYDIMFNFISKHKLNIKTNNPFRQLCAINSSQYMLFGDSEKGIATLYDLSKEEVMEEVTYLGLIAEPTAVSNPFCFANDNLYFTPPEVNDYVFIYDIKQEKFVPTYHIDGDGYSVSESDMSLLNSVQERAKFISVDSRKYTPIGRLYNGKYIVSTYIKKQRVFVNILNLETKNNYTFKKDRYISPNLPSFFGIKDNIAYAIIHPNEINDFIDENLVQQKGILDEINIDDNPYIVRYNIKM